MTLTVEDRLVLQDLVHRYAAYVDERHVDGAVALFTADGVLATARPPKHLDPVDEHVGHEAVRAALSAVEALPLTVHAVTGTVFDAHPDGARGRVVCTASHVSEHGDVRWSVRYLDRYVPVGGTWRIARRELHVDTVEVRPLKAFRSR